jgi:hypothetical protein
LILMGASGDDKKRDGTGEPSPQERLDPASGVGDGKKTAHPDATFA